MDGQLKKMMKLNLFQLQLYLIRRGDNQEGGRGSNSRVSIKSTSYFWA